MPIEIIDAASGSISTDVLSNWAANAALEHILAGDCYLAAFLADPTPLGFVANEVAGGGYQPQPIKFAAASGRTRVSSSAQTFPGMPECTVTHLGVLTAISGGHLVFAKKLDTPIKVPQSGHLIVPAGDVAVML
jgi:hypothetical protein